MAWIKLNATTPAAPAGARNTHFRIEPGHAGTQDDPIPVTAYLSEAQFKQLADVPGSYAGQGGLMVAVKGDETGLEFIASVAGATVHPIIGFTIADGTAGVNVGPMLVPGRGGEVDECVVIVKASHPNIALKFIIRQNGGSVFASTPTIPPGTAEGDITVIAPLASDPLAVLTTDKFQIDIEQGSELWQFTALLRNSGGTGS